jgi:hypothetical protein
MTCRSCGATIADKAIVCYRCGTPTADPASLAPVRPPAPRRPPVVAILLLLAIAGVTAWLAPTTTPDSATRVAAWTVVGIAVALALWLLRSRVR